tara:strand:- start:69012 stop:69314 length:303 start_codon:yes stop_codon:yes gene_type:complete
MDTNLTDKLLPGVFEKKTNCRIYYAYVSTVFVTLILILILTIVTFATIKDVDKMLQDSTVILNDLNELIPQAKLGLAIKKVLCSDGNFTKFYPRYAEVVC